MGQKLTKAPRGDYDAIVYIEGDEVVAEDSTGRKIASGVAGTNDATVIQAALDNLTSGRTTNEIITLVGDFVIDIQIDLPSFTTWDAVGAKFTQKDSAGITILRSDNCTNIDIIGGRYDMNKSNNTIASVCIWLVGCLDCKIKGAEIYNQQTAYCSSIALSGSHRCTISKNYIHEGADYGINLGGCQYCKILDNTILDAYHHAVQIGWHESDSNLSMYNVISGNHIIAVNVATMTGIKTRRSQKNIIASNVVISINADPIGIGIHTYVETTDDIDSSDNLIYNNILYRVDSGIILTGDYGHRVVGNKIYVTTDVTGNGIAVLINTIVPSVVGHDNVFSDNIIELDSSCTGASKNCIGFVQYKGGVRDVFQSNTILNFPVGICLNGVVGMDIKYNTINMYPNATYHHGILMNTYDSVDVSDINVVGNTITDVLNNTSVNSIGISLSGYRHTFENNVINSMTYESVVFGYARYITFVGNVLKNARRWGIDVGVGDTVVHANISNNTFKGNSTYIKNQNDCIRLTSDASYIVIKNNEFIESVASRAARYDINEAIGSDYNIIESNICRGFGTAALYLTGSNTKSRNNIGHIAPGEPRSASGSLTAGNANAIAFAWHNPELQDILIKKVTIRITTPGGTAGSLLDVGIADDAAGTNRGTEFFDDIDLNAAAIVKSTVATPGTQTVEVFCQDSVSATDGWIVGQILVANAAALVGSYYIEYEGA